MLDLNPTSRTEDSSVNREGPFGQREIRQSGSLQELPAARDGQSGRTSQVRRERERFRMRGAQASLVKTRPDKSPVALRGPRVVRLAGAA